MHGAVDGDLVGVDVEVPGVGGRAAPLLGLVGVEAAQGVVDGALDLREGAPVGDGGEVRVDVARRRRGQSDWVAWAILRAFQTADPAGGDARPRASGGGSGARSASPR